VLLVITAMSKMALYIATYGLSRLRVYTFWFMVVLLLVFLVLIVWHVRPQWRAGRPLALIALTLTLALFLAPTDTLIARYNTQQYLGGATEKIDVDMLASLSDAALPSLYELRDTAPDARVREWAQQAIADHRNGVYQGMLYSEDAQNEYYNWNMQSWLAAGLE